VSRSVGAVSALRAAGRSNPGLHREVNEDRFHIDVSRGLFIVIDGVGGQAAGGKAADTAVTMLRARLERETGPTASRLREAIAVANNQIHQLASRRSEWSGMACVLTAVVVADGRATVGHVGDTRLYKLRRGRIEKVTRDHSPVGEREDAQELSERDAMQHPRRNEVYRDVGSEPHEPGDPGFIDVHELPFEPDAALLLCSDGLTDLVDSSSINAIVRRSAGRPQQVVHALIDAANAAGGKDNVTVVYVEGEQFAPPAADQRSSAAEITRRLGTVDSDSPARARTVRFANVVLLAALMVLAFTGSDGVAPPSAVPNGAPAAAEAQRVFVHPTESITQAIEGAPAGSTIVVEPGEYRESVKLKSSVRLVSRVARGAVIRLPGASPAGAAAVVARGVTGAEIEGFRIVGDAATPLGVGVLAVDSEVSISNVEIGGAAAAAIEVAGDARVKVIAADIRDNPGAAVAVRRGGDAVVSHSIFARNGTADTAQKMLVVDEGSTARFNANVFLGVTANVFPGPRDARAAFARLNWFINARPPAPSRAAPQGR
jgi:serine/threonine protein phosphatase PrpC